MAATEGTCLKCTVPLPPESAHGAQLFLASSASFLRSQTDHVLLDRVRACVCFWGGGGGA